MTGFRLLLFVPSPVLEVSPLECSRSGSVYVLYWVSLSQVSDWVTAIPVVEGSVHPALLDKLRSLGLSERTILDVCMFRTWFSE